MSPTATTITMTVTAIRTGLSPLAIGGITGGVLGIALLLCLAVIFILLKRQKSGSTDPHIEPRLDEVADVSPESNISMRKETAPLSGRLQYPETT